MASINKTSSLTVASTTPPDPCARCTCTSKASPAANTEKTIWQKIDGLRHEDALIAGTQITGFLGIATLAAWIAYATSSSVSLKCPLSATLLTGALAKFYGGSDGAIAVFTDYFPKSLELTRSQMKPMPEAGPTGIWQGAGVDVRWSQFFDGHLANEISHFLTGEGIVSAWDFGCGQDDYTKVLAENGIKCNGLEGNADLVALSGGTALLQDLAVPFQLEKRDCVISLEVGGKIPEEYADQFLKNIDAHAKDMVIISWPVEGQKGPLQLNRQNNDYVIAKMGKLGWKLDTEATHRLRDHAHPICYWFKNTTMVFRRADA